jgi:hypothetical protein
LTLVLVFLLAVLFPHFTLQAPINMTLPTGEKLIFYSLGRVIRIPSPGQFHLPRDKRTYVFYYTSWRPLDEFLLNFGSLDGEFDVDIKYFDLSLFKGTVSKEMKSIQVSPSAFYRFKKRYLYRLSIELHRTSGVIAYTNPFLFSFGVRH